jgi:hypothetical protein
MIRADFIPALRWDWPIMPDKIMQARPEGGGSFENGLLHSRLLPRGRMNQRPQAFPTLLSTLPLPEMCLPDKNAALFSKLNVIPK